MTPKQFIEKAISQGYTLGIIHGERLLKEATVGFYNRCVMDSIFLDPLAWQAVGKVEGWGDYAPYDTPNTDPKLNSWRFNMHCMIDALCEGKSTEQFLETL